LILLKKSDLSTEKNAFTITTIFIYRSIVNRQKKRKTGDISKKHANNVKKKANGDSASHCQTVFQESAERQCSGKNRVRDRSALIARQGSVRTKQIKHATTARKNAIFACRCG